MSKLSRLVVTVVVFAMLLVALPTTTVAQASADECAAFPNSGVGPGNKVITTASVASRPRPNIVEGQPYDVIPKGAERMIAYGPSCTKDYQRYYLCTLDNARCGWVAIGKQQRKWFVLSAPYVNTCVAQLVTSYYGFRDGAQTLEAVYRYPQVSGLPLAGNPGTVGMAYLGSDGIYQHWQLTIANPERWGYGDGPLGEPMLYYYC